MKPNPRPTGSSWHRAWKCAASVVLPQNADLDREDASEPMRNHGTTVHAFLEAAKSGGDCEAIIAAAPPRMRELLSQIDIGQLPPDCSTEVAFAINMRDGSVRELGRNLGHRDYASLGVHPRAELPFTLDLSAIYTTENGEVVGYAGDHKSGHIRYPEPDKFGQTLLGGVALAELYGASRVVLVLNYIDDDGRMYPVRRVMDAWDLASIKEEFMDAWRRIDELEVEYAAGRPLPVVEGNHCKYCRAYDHCPAKVALVRAIPAELGAMGIRLAVKNDQAILEVDPGTTALSMPHVGAAYVAIEHIQDVLKQLKDRICGLAYHVPIQLPDGRVLERQITRRRTLDGPTAAGILEARYGREAARKALDIKVPISAVEDVVRSHLQKGQKMNTRKGDGVADQVLAEIERAGGLSVDVSEVVRAKVPKHPR